MPDRHPQALPDILDRLVQASFDPRYGEAWSHRQLADALVLPTTHCLLIAADGSVVTDDSAVGFALSRRILDEEELLLFAIEPEERGRGLGAALLKHFIAHAIAGGARRIFLETRRDNPAARLYSAHGFVPVGVRPDYYRGTGGVRIDSISYSLSPAIDN